MILHHRLTLLLLTATLMLSTGVTAQSDDRLVLLMTEIPGQTMSDEDESGTALEIIRAAAKRAGIQLSERFLPWPRAVSQVESNPNHIIIPFSRTEKRENRFAWVEQVYNLELGFVSLDTRINGITEARTLKKIGVWRGTSMVDDLKGFGFNNLIEVSNDQTLTRMLVGGRFGAWYGSLNEAAYKFRGVTDVNGRRIRFGAPVRSTPIWIGANKQTPAPLLERLRQAIREMKEDGSVKAVLTRYGM